jgi:hypothetical protein
MDSINPFIVLLPIKENNMIDDIFAKFDGAFAKNTIRAYQIRLYPIPNLVL